MIRDIKTNYSGGEFSPRMFGRIDLQERYSGGCLLVDNYIPLPQGGLLRRPGTRFLKQLDTGINYRLIAYTPASDLSYLLLFSDEKLEIFQAFDVLTAFGDYSTALGSPLQTLVTPFAGENLQKLRYTPAKTEDGEYVCIFTDGEAFPQQLLFTEGASPLFSLSGIPFTSHAFRDPDKSNNTLKVVDEAWVMKLVSSNATEFDSLTAPYVEWRKGNKWVLGRVLTTTTTPAAPSDPAGNTCYIEPVTAIVEDIADSAKMVVLDHTYDDTIIPIGRRHIRSDTLVFNYSLEDAFVRVTSDYSKIRTSAATGSSYGVGGAKFGDTMWLKITDYLGTNDYPIDFIRYPSKADVTVGSTYRILTPGVSISVSAPMDGGSISWDDSYTYTAIGDSFSAQNHFRFNAYSSGEIANLTTQKTFDVVECDPEVTFHSCTGSVNISGEYETEGHTATLISEKDLFTYGSFEGVEEGQYILAEHGSENFVLYLITSIVSEKEATVTVKAGELKRKESSSEIINGGITSDYRVSEWSEGNFPRAVAWYERRLVFAGCASAPESIWLSRVSDIYDFRTIDDDGAVTDDAGITYPLAGKTMNEIVAIVSGPVLLIGSESAIWQMRKSYDGEAITPSNISITEETADGCFGEAIKIGSSVLFVDLSRQNLTELVYSYEINGFESTNMNLLSDHLFKGDQVKTMCYQHRPYTLIWVVTEAGNLFSITYNKKQGTYAWARHTTQGLVKDVVLLQNPTELSGYDRVVFLVERNGFTCLEMLEEFYEKDEEADNRGFTFLDCCVRGFPPTAVTQPVSFTGDLLESHDFSFVVDGLPLNYQWYKDGVILPGEEEATLSLLAVTATDAGLYKCRVWNNWGEVWSDEVVCNSYPPALTLDPVETSYYVNSEGTFALSVAGTGSSPETFTYTWYKDGEALAPVTTATNLFPATEANAGEYYCVFASQWGSATSATVVAGVIEDWDGVQDDDLDTVTVERDGHFDVSATITADQTTTAVETTPVLDGVDVSATLEAAQTTTAVETAPVLDGVTLSATFIGSETLA